jgi:hypothetical protein
MRKVACLLLSGAMVVSLLGSTVAFAAENEMNISDLEAVGEIGFEFMPVERSVKQADSELLAASNMDEIAEISKRRFEADPSNYSEEKIAHVASVMSEYDLIENSTDGIVAIADESDYVIGNKSIVAFFCIEDGVSALDVATAKSLADDAATNAETAYPNQSDAGGLRDSYRHFTWNHMMTEELSKSDARIIACNYEWAAILLDYAQDTYQEYLDDGLSTTSAAYKACLYAYYLREDYYSVCAAGQAYFAAIFDKAAVRDLWNNCYGRAYAEDYSYTYGTAFYVAKANNELINSDSAVTDSHINSVWSWDWYTA